MRILGPSFVLHIWGFIKINATVIQRNSNHNAVLKKCIKSGQFMIADLTFGKDTGRIASSLTHSKGILIRAEVHVDPLAL